ncbi:VCBS repeat-containing protein [Nannocystis sp. SCPEA4]|uniref:FG-GAP-like repeat-containing protein n=1 Tax=Nannocystis sp. SCPEA4 TaxID=2996787 RepID=UPI00226FCFED|nr:VCBS repeat-containing protein [Nannocystis sp. SCPEA4]
MQFATEFAVLATADLDDDGDLDLVGVATTSGALTVVWGGGSGVAGVTTTWTVGREAAGLVIADLDGDGRLDLATAIPTDDAVVVLYGRGGRSFAAPEFHPAGSVPRDVLAADLDGVAPLELVTADLGSGTVTVLRDGATAPFVVGPGPRGLAAGDLDGDGDTDLAVALADDGAIQVLLGDGTGRLLPGPKHPVGGAPYSLVVADLDDDGNLDLAAADPLTDTIAVLFSDGIGSHAAARIFPTLAQPESLAVVRDENSRPVLAVTSRSTPKIARLDPRDGTTRATAMANGWPASAIAAGEDGRIVYTVLDQTGTLSPGEGLVTTSLWRDPDIAGISPIDLEGDGVDEFIVKTSTTGDALALWRGPGFGEDLEVDLAGEGLAARADDLTGDGLRDVVVWTSEEWVALIHQPDGALLPAGAPMKLPPDTRPVALGDRDGDGRSELLLVHEEPESTELQWWTADADPPVAAEQRLVPHQLRATYLVDGDGDARADLLLRTDDALLWYEDSGDLTRTIDIAELYDYRHLAFADVDGDGALDVVACGFPGLAIRRAILASDATAPSSLHDRGCSDVTIVDLDGDGALDLLAKSRVSRSLVLAPWLQRAGEWREYGRELVPLPSDAVALEARLDDDGVPDLVTFDYEAGDAQALRLALEPALVDSPGSDLGSLDAYHLGDLDGDGAADILAAGGSLAVAFADRRGGFDPLTRRTVIDAFGPGAALVASAVADFDGDGTDEWIVVIHQPLLGQSTLHTVTFDRAGMLAHERIATLPPIDRGELHAADLDGDGALDLVAFTVPTALDSIVLRGDGHGHFAAPRLSATPNSSDRVGTRLFDVDRDGHLDVLAVSSQARTLSCAAGRGDGSFAAPRALSDVPASAYAAGDVDRDGSTDLAVVHPFVGDLLLGRAGAREAPRRLLEQVGVVDLLDLDRDGDPELVAIGADVLYLGRLRDDGRLAFLRHEAPTNEVHELRSGDIDGDGALDLALFGPRGVTTLRQMP